MSEYSRMDEITERHNGIIRTSYATDAGVSKDLFLRYVRSRGFERAAHGIYVSPDAWWDDLYILQLRFPQAVFSHESALCLHGMTDRVPLKPSVTLKTGYNPSSLTKCGIKAYTVKESLYSMGVTHIPTIFGNIVSAYDPERTVCDVMRSRRTVEIQVFEDALCAYVKRKDLDFGRLMAYSRKFGIYKMLAGYIGILMH